MTSPAVEAYVSDALNGFAADPPDSDYQRGFLSAMLAVWNEGLGKGEGDERLPRLTAMTKAAK